MTAFHCPICESKFDEITRISKPLENIVEVVSLDENYELTAWETYIGKTETVCFKCECGYQSPTIDTFIKNKDETETDPEDDEYVKNSLSGLRTGIPAQS